MILSKEALRWHQNNFEQLIEALPDKHATALLLAIEKMAVDCVDGDMDRLPRILRITSRRWKEYNEE